MHVTITAESMTLYSTNQPFSESCNCMRSCDVSCVTEPTKYVPCDQACSLCNWTSGSEPHRVRICDVGLLLACLTIKKLFLHTSRWNITFPFNMRALTLGLPHDESSIVNIISLDMEGAHPDLCYYTSWWNDENSIVPWITSWWRLLLLPRTETWPFFLFFYFIQRPQSEALSTQKFKTHLLRTKFSRVLPSSIYPRKLWLLPWNLLLLISTLPAYLPAFFFQNLHRVFHLLAVVNTGSCVGPQKKN